MKISNYMISIVLLLVFILTINTNLKAQVFEYGDVPLEQLLMDVYEKDSSANAVILFDKGKSELKYEKGDGFKLVFKRHTRIKILQDAGIDYANVVLRFKDKNPKQKIDGIRAHSYTMGENGSILEQKLSKNDIYDQEIINEWSELKFSVPNVKKGSVFEYSFELEMNFSLWYPTWYFQSDIPTIWSEYSTSIPEFYTYSYQPFGIHDLHIKKSDTSVDKIRFNYEVRNESNRIGNSNMGSRFSETVDFKVESIYLVMKDIPSLPDEPYIRSREQNKSRVEFQFTHVRYPGQQTYSYTQSWDNLIKDLLSYPDFGKKLKSNNDLKATNQLYTYGIVDEIEKIKVIYNLVLEKIEWNGLYGVFLDKDVIKVFKEGEGNGSEINMALIQMLRDADLNAYPLLVSTHENGPVNTLLGVVDQFNHTLVYVDLGEQAVILDATDRNRPFSILPENVLGTTGLLMYPEQIIWIPIQNTAQNISVKTIMLHLTEDGYYGSLKAQNSGYYAVDIRSNFDEKDTLSYFQDHLFPIESQSKITKVSSISDDFEKGLNYILEFENNEISEGNFIYFNPMVIGRLKTNPFQLENRFFPVDYNYSFQEMLTMNITIPDGWTVDELPKPIIYRLPDNSAEYQRIIQASSTSILMRYILKVNKPQFLPSEYNGIKDLYNQLVKTHSERIVLKKTL